MKLSTERGLNMDMKDRYEEEMGRWALENRTRANKILDRLVAVAMTGFWLIGAWAFIAWLVK
jgi:hypothetical protein